MLYDKSQKLSKSQKLLLLNLNLVSFNQHFPNLWSTLLLYFYELDFVGPCISVWLVSLTLISSKLICFVTNYSFLYLTHSQWGCSLSISRLGSWNHQWYMRDCTTRDCTTCTTRSAGHLMGQSCVAHQWLEPVGICATFSLSGHLLVDTWIDCISWLFE